MPISRRVVVLSCVITAVSFSLNGQNMADTRAHDPGARGGAAGAGGPIAGLSLSQIAMFNAAKSVFQEIDSVAGTIPGESGKGLGPSFNMNSCVGCHKHPADGGSSPSVNPQIAVATLHGARNVPLQFISLQGPVREARFKRNPDGTPD